MKKIFSKSKVLNRIAFSYIMTGVISVAVLSVIYSNLLTNQIINSRYSQASSALKVSSSSTMLFLEEIYARYFQLFATDETLTSYKNDLPVNVDIQNRLATLVYNDFLVDSIVLVDVANATVIESFSRNTQLNQSADTGLITMLEDLRFPNSAIRNLIFYPRKTEINQQPKEYLTLTFTFSAAPGQISKVMFVNIDENLLAKLLTVEGDDHTMIIVNRFGQIIADSSDRRFNTYYFSQEYITDKSIGIPADNVYIAQVYDEESLVSTLDTPKFDLTFFSIYDYRTISTEVNRSNAIVILLFGVLLIIIAAISIFLSQKLYSPIQRMVLQIAKINQVHPDVHTDEFDFIFDALSHLDQRKISDEIRSVMEGKRVSKMELDWSSTHIIVLQPRFVNTDQSLNTLAGRYLWELFQPNMTVTDDFGFAAFATRTQIETFEQWQNHGWIAGISHKIEKSDQISKCYRQAKAACEFAMTREDVSIQYYQDIVSHQSDDVRLQIKNQLHSYIQNHFSDPQSSIEQLAIKLRYSVGYVRQLFKDEMGVPFNEYLTNFRMEEAKRLLIETDMSATEVAVSIGMEDVRYFYTVFKSKTGMTAQQYRKEMMTSGRK